VKRAAWPTFEDTRIAFPLDDHVCRRWMVPTRCPTVAFSRTLFPGLHDFGQWLAAKASKMSLS